MARVRTSGVGAVGPASGCTRSWIYTNLIETAVTGRVGAAEGRMSRLEAESGLRKVSVGPLVILCATVASGLIWWSSAWLQGRLSGLSDRALSLTFVFGAIQFASWLVILLLHFPAAKSPATGNLSLKGPILVLLGNLLYYFTPVVGAAALVIICPATAWIESRRVS